MIVIKANDDWLNLKAFMPGGSGNGRGSAKVVFWKGIAHIRPLPEDDYGFLLVLAVNRTMFRFQKWFSAPRRTEKDHPTRLRGIKHGRIGVLYGIV